MSHSHYTPNVTIENPKVRKVVRTTIDILLLLLVAVMAGDAASEIFDVSAFTVPALAVLGVLRAGFGLGVDNPNTPKDRG